MNPARSRTLIFIGWGMFVVALFCPALRVGDVVWPGWKCFLATICFFPLCFANALFLFGVLVYSWGGGLERKAYGVFLAVAAVATIAGVLWAWDGLLTGAYLWLGAFPVAALGFYLADSLDDPPRK